MKLIYIFSSIILFLMFPSHPLFSQEWKKKYGTEDMRSNFGQPPMFYAPHAFWFWDDTLRDDGFPARMATKMIEQRLNPGYAHPRSSMDGSDKFPSLPKEQYLGKIWFDSFERAVKVTKDAGFTLGYCDDYNWPSGQGAGRILESNPELEAQYLDWKRHQVAGGTLLCYDTVDFAVAAKLVEQKIDASSLRILEKGNAATWTAPTGDWVVYTYKKKHHQGIDGGKVNYLDPKLMEVFIPLVHEAYAKRFGGDIGRTIPGSFVDNEGDYGWQMAWSAYFAQTYQSLKKRDIRLWLPLLTEKDKDGVYVKARYDWFEMVSQVYNECYFKPINAYLEKNGMYYISNLWEESLQFQTAAVGDFMQISRTATMPGTDALVMKSQEVHDFKEVQTVSELENRPFMSEVMGVAGWEQTPEMMKMTINSITSFGVNHVVPHGIYLNRKINTYPFPADWYTENPYWPYLHYWTDFARRAAFVNRQTQLVADVLLLKPMESIWASASTIFSHPNEGIVGLDANSGWDSVAVHINDLYSQAMRSMNENNIDFLIGDKYYLDKANIEKTDKKTSLQLNDHIFSTLILPPLTVISRVVAAKIVDFAKQGGTVILLGELPKGSPEVGERDQLIMEQMALLTKFPTVHNFSSPQHDLDSMIDFLLKDTPQIRLTGAGRLFTAHRQIKGTHYYWFSNNTDSLKNFTAWVKAGKGTAELWNCETGDISAISFEKDQDYNKLSLTLQPYEGYWVVFNPQKEYRPSTMPAPETFKERALSAKWFISYPGKDIVQRTSAKAMVSEEKILAQERLAPNYDDSSWKRMSIIDAPEKKNREAEPTTHDAETSKASRTYWRMVIPAGASSVTLPAEMSQVDLWIDGKHKTRHGQTMKLSKEARLLGFSISNDRELASTPIEFKMGSAVARPLSDWFAYGLDEYSGYVDYETEMVVKKSETQAIIDLGKVKYMAEVFVNDQSVGARMWPPYRFDLHPYLKEGKNTIRVRVGNLMVNHMSMQDDLHKLRTWSWGFSPKPALDDYKAGLFGPVKLRIRN